MLPKLIVSLPTLLVILCLSAGVPAADLEWRTWTDATGQYRVRAAFVELKDDRVWLRKADGSTVGVPLDRLSAADQGRVARETVPSGMTQGFGLAPPRNGSPSAGRTVTANRPTRGC